MTTRGRPRDHEARERILTATRDLLHADGFEGTTMEGIASRAGVAKQTIYRWWPSKVAVVAEAALDARHSPPERVDAVLTGNLRADVGRWIDDSIARLAKPETAALLRAFAAAAAADPESARQLYERQIALDRQALGALLMAESSSGLPLEPERAAAIADIAMSPLFFWVLSHQPIDASRRNALRDLVVGALER
jgi:AcrR family transcriptional regulator